MASSRDAAWNSFTSPFERSIPGPFVACMYDQRVLSSSSTSESRQYKTLATLTTTYTETKKLSQSTSHGGCCFFITKNAITYIN